MGRCSKGALGCNVEMMAIRNSRDDAVTGERVRDVVSRKESTAPRRKCKEDTFI